MRAGSGKAAPRVFPRVKRRGKWYHPVGVEVKQPAKSSEGTSGEASPQGWRATRRKWVLQKGKRLRKRLIRFLGRQSLVGDPPVFPDGTFPWASELERNADAIREELDAILEHRRLLPLFGTISTDNARIAQSERWKLFLFYGFGGRSQRNCVLCPRTAAVLDGIPGLRSAWFSILAPRMHIPSHRGISKGIVRAHLGLVVPEDRAGCRMLVGEETVTWDEGRCLVFDDMRRHEVWNDTDEERVVLLLDVDRPLRPIGRAVSRLFGAVLQRTAYVRDARRNHIEWEDRFHAALGEHGSDAVLQPFGESVGSSPSAATTPEASRSNSARGIPG